MDVKATLNGAMDASSQGQLDSLERLGKQAKDIGKIKKLAADFEAMFTEQMLKGMRTSVQKSGLIDGGNAEEIYTSMLDSEYAKNMTTHSSTGLADMVERQLLESMGVKSDISRKLNKRGAIHSYEKVARPTLQEATKPVTMDSLALPALQLKTTR